MPARNCALFQMETVVHHILKIIEWAIFPHVTDSGCGLAVGYLREPLYNFNYCCCNACREAEFFEMIPAVGNSSSMHIIDFR